MSAPASKATTKLQALSQCDQADFVKSLGSIFEHSPWIAERAWQARPFDDIDALHAAMFDVVERADRQEKLELIRAHPELAGKEAAAGVLTVESTGEQRQAGLDRCSAEELTRLRDLNTAYRQRFGFPFVIAVKGLGKHAIMDALATRMSHDAETEFNTCIQEIGKIARFRLDALLKN